MKVVGSLLNRKFAKCELLHGVFFFRNFMRYFGTASIDVISKQLSILACNCTNTIVFQPYDMIKLKLNLSLVNENIDDIINLVTLVPFFINQF